MEERRENERVGIAFPVECTLIPERKKYFFTVSKDLSLGGVKILSDELLPCGKNIKININLITETAVAKAKVVWCSKMSYSERYCVGLTFLEINEKNKSSLSNFINKIKYS